MSSYFCGDWKLLWGSLIAHFKQPPSRETVQELTKFTYLLLYCLNYFFFFIIYKHKIQLQLFKTKDYSNSQEKLQLTKYVNNGKVSDKII